MQGDLVALAGWPRGLPRLPETDEQVVMAMARESLEVC